MFQTKFVEKIKTHILCSITSFWKLCRLWDKVKKNMVKLERPQMTVWRKSIACWISKSTNTHSEYVILIDFPLKEWLHKCASVCSVIYAHRSLVLSVFCSVVILCLNLGIMIAGFFTTYVESRPIAFIIKCSCASENFLRLVFLIFCSVELPIRAVSFFSCTALWRALDPEHHHPECLHVLYRTLHRHIQGGFTTVMSMLQFLRRHCLITLVFCHTQAGVWSLLLVEICLVCSYIFSQAGLSGAWLLLLLILAVTYLRYSDNPWLIQASRCSSRPLGSSGQ